MKKYVAAAAVAVMVFAFSAFAASFQVNGGVLQAGQDDKLTCADNADVTYDWEDHNGVNWVRAFNVTFDDDCVGNTLVFSVLRANNSELGKIHVPIDSNTLSIPVVTVGDGLTEDVHGTGVLVSEIEKINILVASGPDRGNGWHHGIFGEFSPED